MVYIYIPKGNINVAVMRHVVNTAQIFLYCIMHCIYTLQPRGCIWGKEQ